MPLFLATLFACVTLWTGCATQSTRSVSTRPFSFGEDTLAYANELKWQYSFDQNGKWSAKKREPSPDYSLHCFVVARSARQFFEKARFDSAQPKVSEATYQKLVRKVVKSNPRTSLPQERKVVIPGYANLHEFSQKYEGLLKKECGGAWQSYFQRGHWRMVFPFSRRHQVNTATKLSEEVRLRSFPVVHLVCFPSLAINHAVVLFDVKERAGEIEFAVYDPNKPEKPSRLTFDRARQVFIFPGNDYFIGGKVNVYEVYRSPFF